jgi:hypothetical protein
MHAVQTPSGDRPSNHREMTDMQRMGFLVVLMDAPPAFEDEFNAWYDTEHVPQRMAVPGFERAQRYVCFSGHPRYLAIYDMTSPDVLDSDAYLQVSLDRSSPWTKRVASRVRIYRSAGAQVYPGNALTRQCARTLLLRFRGLKPADEPAIVEGMRANFEARPETIQVRVMANVTGSAVDFLGVVEARAPLGDALLRGSFGRAADALDLVNTYALY